MPQPTKPRASGKPKALFLLPNSKLRSDLQSLLNRFLPGLPSVDMGGYPLRHQLVDTLGTENPSVCFLDIGSDQDRSLALLSDLTNTRPGLPVVAILPKDQPDLILRCLRQGATEFLLHPFQDDQAALALEKLDKLHSANSSGMKGKVCCVMPVKGGCGASTLAANLAYQWKRVGSKRVLLADLDPLAGTLSFLLKMKSVYSFVDVLQRHADLDEDLWESLTVTRNGVDVLLSPESVVEGLDDLTDPSPVIDYGRSHYEYVITDVNGVYGPWNLSQAEAADEVLLVTTAELPALQAAQRALAYLDENHIGRWKVRVVVNRHAEDIGLRQDMIATALQTDVYHVLPSDYASVQQALMDGKPSPNSSAFGKAVMALANRLAGREEPRKKGSSLAGLLSLFSRTSG